MEIPEKAQAEALQEVARRSAERAEALAAADRATEALKEAAVSAAKLGAGRSRIRELSAVSASTLYGWLEAAGLEIRAKRPAKRGGGT